MISVWPELTHSKFPDKPYAEVLAVAVEDGLLSPQLHNLVIGDEIENHLNRDRFHDLAEILRVNSKDKHLWFWPQVQQ